MLTLPAEIRNRIWEMCVSGRGGCHGEEGVSPYSIFIGIAASKRPAVEWLSSQAAVQPQITRVCRQIRDESLGLFYGTNQFEIELIAWAIDSDDPERYCHASSWLRAIGPENTKHLGHMKCTVSYWRSRHWAKEKAVALLKEVRVPQNVIDCMKFTR